MPAVRTRGRNGRDSTEAKPRNDAYVGLLTLSLLAMIAACVFLALDFMRSYNGTTQPPKLTGVGPAPAAPAPGPGGPPPPGGPGGPPPGGPGVNPPGK
jgi:hypothetical protein